MFVPAHPLSTRKETKETSSKSGGVVSDNYVKNQDYQLPPTFGFFDVPNKHTFFVKQNTELNTRKPKPTKKPISQPTTKPTHQPNHPTNQKTNPTEPIPIHFLSYGVCPLPFNL